MIMIAWYTCEDACAQTRVFRIQTIIMSFNGFWPVAREHHYRRVLVCTHDSFLIRCQRGHPGVVLPLVISDSANH